MMQNHRRIGALAVLMLVASGFGVCGPTSEARAETGETALAGMSVVAINRDTGELWRYDYPDGQRTVIGTVRNAEGESLKELAASAWFDGFGGLYGFRRDPDTGTMQLVYVNLETAKAREEDLELGPGLVRGAATAVVDDPDAPRGRRWWLFAVQRQDLLGRNIEGATNLNPNNSGHGEFVLVTPDGRQITRDDLHHGETDEDGVYYEGPARLVRLKPKGNANRNGLTVDGETYPLRNGRTYYFHPRPDAEPMHAVVYNTHARQGNGNGNGSNGGGNGNNAMGHWWLELQATSASISWDGPDNGSERVYDRADRDPSRLIRIDTGSGEMETVMTLQRDYAGLSCDESGEELFTVHDGDVYRIDPAEGTETRVSGSAPGTVAGLQRTDERLVKIVRYGGDDGDADHRSAGPGEDRGSGSHDRGTSGSGGSGGSGSDEPGASEEDGEEANKRLIAVDAEDGTPLSDSIETGSAHPGAAVVVPTARLPGPEQVAFD